MSYELFTITGKRKYLSSQELDLFIATAKAHERPEVRTLCLVLAHTGARLSEVLALTSENIDLSDGVVVYRTLKQRDRVRFRSVPVPASTLDAIEIVHRLRKNQKGVISENGK